MESIAKGLAKSVDAYTTDRSAKQFRSPDIQAAKGDNLADENEMH